MLFGKRIENRHVLSNLIGIMWPTWTWSLIQTLANHTQKMTSRIDNLPKCPQYVILEDFSAGIRQFFSLQCIRSLLFVSRLSWILDRKRWLGLCINDNLHSTHTRGKMPALQASTFFHTNMHILCPAPFCSRAKTIVIAYVYFIIRCYQHWQAMWILCTCACVSYIYITHTHILVDSFCTRFQSFYFL